MAVSWIERAKQFKSPVKVVAGFLLRSRETQSERAKRKARQVRELKKIVAGHEETIRRQQAELAEKEAQLVRLKIENQRLWNRPPVLPDDPPLPYHEFGPKMIALCVNMARRIGLRPAPDILKLVFEALGVEAELPHWTSIRMWMQRVGVAALERPIERVDDMIWMADHSNQIGSDKALSIIGVRASKLPPPGQPLRHEDVCVLELKPGTSWKREDMRDAYEQLAQRVGPPLALLTDGAVELREGAEMCSALEQNGQKPILLGDFKHYASNVLKKIVGGDERYSELGTQLGRTRSSIQQTELAHFTPPRPKPKARFMNLKPTLLWVQMVLWQLFHPDSDARAGIAAERMEEKLGGWRAFGEDIGRWAACQDVVSAASTFVNEQGVFRGAARQLRDHLRSLHDSRDGPKDAPHRRVAARLLRFVRQSEFKLSDKQRLPLSTEILESSFGLFKQLEGQHSKGGFTGLLAAYGCLLHTATPESIRRDFAQVSVKQARDWVSKNLGKTLASKRTTAYREFRHAA